MKHKPLHHWLPFWINNTITKCHCVKCQHPHKKEDIFSVGIRNSNKKSFCLYIEQECSSCGHRALVSFPNHKEDNVEGMCYFLLEQIKQRKSTEKANFLPKKKKKGPMTDKEVAKFINFMNQSNHEDFLKEIGVVFPPRKKSNES